MSRQHQYLRYHSLSAQSQVHGLFMPPSASRFESLAPVPHVQSTLPSMYIIATPRVIARVIHDLRHDSPLQSAQSCGAGNTISIGRIFYMCVSTFILPVFNTNPSI
ncbi:hypothetical protein K443DRAFT_637686 [Laccaria amethystina LaAM-08-1]|uniref:Uncharacterized protein n=1 Tax=Laccaria amethystina LaAM-08-1 TaxID=1095629 RepID=A0A0C9X3S7_9AGAR|nr:hypothetical protein K443DRAFT_637686 [Laccaria amethystina LaAM-08-1]